MAFRYLIYSTGTTFAETIVRESAVNDPGVNEASLFSDFVIPVIQPLYLWRVTGGTTVVPNTDSNIENYLDATIPPDPDDPVTLAEFTGYTAVTQITIDTISGATDDNAADIAYISGVTDNNFTIFQTFTAQTTNDLVYISGITDNKLDKVSGATTGNVPVFGDSGNTLIDSGFDIADLTGSTGGVTEDEFTGYTATTEIRLQGIESDITYISGITDTKLDTSIFNTYTGDTRTELDLTITGATNGLTKTGRDALLGGTLTQNTSIDGSTGTYNLEFLNLNAFNISFDSVSTITDNGANGGLRYGADYSGQFVNRSLVDKAYVDAVAAGLDLKESVRAATTTGDTDIDLAGGTFGGTIDGYTVQDGDRVLIKNQDSAKEDNGIYVYASGTNTFSRAIDFENPFVTSGAFTFVETGTTQNGTGWVLVTQDPISIGTTELTFTQFSSTGSISAGVGIDITNGVVSFDGGAVAGDNLEWTGTVLNVTGVTQQSDFNSFTAQTENNFTFISGVTDQNTNDIQFISGVTDQNTNDILFLSAVTSGLTENTVTKDEFTGYTATTEIRLQDIENDISFISGITDTKLDTDIFTGYTASTQSNELFVLHTGGTNLNTVTATAIPWQSGVTIGSAYTYTGGTVITIDETGEYELTYNIPYNQAGSNNDRGIGGNIVINGNIIDITATASWTSRSSAAGSLSLPTVNLSLSAGDKLSLIAFRTAQNGTVTSSPDGSLLIKKKSTLQ